MALAENVAGLMNLRAAGQGDGEGEEGGDAGGGEGTEGRTGPVWAERGDVDFKL